MPRNGSGTMTLPAGNPVVPGTVITSTWANSTLNDVASALTQSLAYDGQTVPIADLPMGNFKHTNVNNAAQRNQYAAYGQVQDGQPQWMTASGTDTILGTIAPGPTAYVAGQVFRFVAAGANTTNTVTLNINTLGAKSVTKNGTTALSAGDIPANAVVSVIYDGTRFQLVGISFAAGAVANTYFSNRNKLINAHGTVNQRGYVSGTNTTVANQYTLDRWRVVTSGQNMGYVANGNGFTLTAPAGGLEQVIEASSIEGGVYYLKWTGTATATVNATPVANGASISVSANTQTTVRFIGGTVFEPQFEIGGVTPFEQRSFHKELDDCEYYCKVLSGNTGASFGVGECFSTTQALVHINVPTSMRIAPTVAFSASADFNLFQAAGGQATVTGAVTFGGSSTSVAMTITVAAGLVGGNSTLLLAANNNAKITLVSEL